METTTEQETENRWSSEVEYLETMLGPKYLPMQLVVPLTLAYVTIFVTGVFGNVATCIVVIRNASMHTATYYYLFSLAISDLTLLLLGLPNELSVFWQQYPWALGVGLCKIRAYVSEMSSYVSVLTIVAFSMERYLAICHPLRVYAMSGLKRPVCFILAAWLIALVAAIPFGYYTTVNYVEYPPDSGNYSEDSAICAMLLPDMPHFPLYELSSIIFFIVPMLVILVVYIRMGLKIRRASKNMLGPMVEGAVHGEPRHVQSKKSIIRMLSAVVIMFFICWAPFHAQRLLYVYAVGTDYYPDLNEWLYILSGCLYYFSTTVNPILYNLMSVKYRTAFKQTICCGMTSRTTWNTRSSRACECDSNERPHFPRTFRRSVRYGMGHAKGMLRPGKCQEDAAKDRNVTVQRKNYTIKKMDSTSRPLINSDHTFASERSSSDSTSSGKKLEESLSTASSIL